MKSKISAYSLFLSDLFATYYRSPNHPYKLRLLTWFEKFCGNKEILIKTKPGFRFVANRIDYIQKTIFETRDWEPEIGALLKKELTQNDIFFDIGANTGYFSCLALLYNVKQVIAFEPRPDLQKMFYFNMEVNHFTPNRWLLKTSALSDQPDNLYYHAGSIHNSGQGRVSKTRVGEYDYIVNVDCLDDLIYKNKLVIPTVMKLDVEGWEINILNGSRKLFTDNPPRIVIFEAYCNCNAEILDRNITDFFVAYNYSIHHIRRLGDLVLENENYIAFKI